MLDPSPEEGPRAGVTHASSACSMVPPTSIDTVGSGDAGQGAPETPQLEPSGTTGVPMGGAVSWQTYLATLDCLDLRAVIKGGTATCPWVPTQL
eukprot:12052683-Prorocentrum_lima.AAC.1